MAKFRMTVNGTERELDSWDPDQPLMYLLRNALGLHATKFGCGNGQCGSCTVLIDGKPVRSCLTPVSAAAGRRVTTLEGLGTPEKPHPVQAAFIAEQAAQCAYCTSGIVMTAVALLADKAQPTRAEVQQALAGNLCRCGSHERVVRAVLRAAADGAGRS